MSEYTLTDQQVLETPEACLWTFHNVYPEGKQGGVELIQHGERVMTNGDLRLEAAPGQWGALPAVQSRAAADGRVSVRLAFPEGLGYTVHTRAEGDALRITVDLDVPLAEELSGRAGFNLELLPTAYYDRSFLADGAAGIFPRQSNGPVVGGMPTPLAQAETFTLVPEDDLRRVTLRSRSGVVTLMDGRDTAHNGWFVLRQAIAVGAKDGVVDWLLIPHRVAGWQRAPVILASQVGYHPDQEKIALIELDPRITKLESATLTRTTPEGERAVFAAEPKMWGRFLSYAYAQFDFSAVTEPGAYRIRYGKDSVMGPFRIGQDVMAQGVWQPTMETYIPTQMCHVRVEDLSRVWHGACHLDDALQAPVNTLHFDSYHQYETTETPYKDYQPIPFLNRGGWHDAGDYDLAAGSQANATLDLALMRESFDLASDQTTVLDAERRVILHRPDGVPDVLQQVKHGVENLLSGYRAAGHSFAGIIESNLDQYTFLGDAASMTNNRIDEGDPSLSDDRWAFTNHDTALEFQVAAALAAAARVLRGYEDKLAAECLETAQGIWRREVGAEVVHHSGAYVPWDAPGMEVLAAVELLITTGEEDYAQRLMTLGDKIEADFGGLGWSVTRALPLINNEAFAARMRQAAEDYAAHLADEEAQNPFALPFGDGWLRANQPQHDPFAADYQPPIWGIGWHLQGEARHWYYLIQAYPDLFTRERVLRVVNYVLGCHPASNLSLVSGVGANSMIIGYGTNRAEWSYQPGGIASGPALLRPGRLELLDPFPFLWQQKEYVIGGATSWVFIVLAAQKLLGER